MSTILDIDNVFEYLSNLNYCNLTDRRTSTTTVIPAKNFNLLINFDNGKNLLIKQEIHNDRGQTEEEFQSAWQIHQLMQVFPELNREIGGFLPEILYFDPENSILIVKYLADYSDLEQYYSTEHQFPVEVAKSIGHLLAIIHRQTFQQPKYQGFFERIAVEQQFATQPNQHRLESSHSVIDLIDRLTRVTPQIFQVTPPECLQFFRLYQRFPALSTAIIDLGKSITPSCLVHHDLKVDNILKLNNISIDSDLQPEATIKLIDWERADWGDRILASIDSTKIDSGNFFYTDSGIAPIGADPIPGFPGAYTF